MARDPTSDTATASEAFYTPWRIRQLLRDYQHLLVPRHHREEPEPRIGARRPASAGWGWLEDAVCRRADIGNALAALNPFTRQIVERGYVLGESDRSLALRLGCDRETVKRHRLDGLELMAWHLGYRGDLTAWRKRGR